MKFCWSYGPLQFFGYLLHSCAQHKFRIMYANVLEFHIWIAYENIGDPYFFLIRIISCFRVISLLIKYLKSRIFVLLLPLWTSSVGVNEWKSGSVFLTSDIFPHYELSPFSHSIYRQWVPREHNSSYNFIIIFLKLWTCFPHSLKMCICFSYNPCLNFCHFFQPSTSINEINLFNNQVLIVAAVTFAPASATPPPAEIWLWQGQICVPIYRIASAIVTDLWTASEVKVACIRVW